MSSETPAREPEEPEPTDEAWVNLRDFVAGASDIGISDVKEMAEVLQTTKNEDIRAQTLKVLDHVIEQWKSVEAHNRRLAELVGAREAVAEEQYRTEIALLSRIRELSSQTAPEDLRTLAETYAQLRHYSVAPGWYSPDVRHTEHEELSGDEDVE